MRRCKDDPQDFDDLKVISNENIDVDDPQNVDNFSAFDDPEGISIGSMEFDLKKVYHDLHLRWTCFYRDNNRHSERSSAKEFQNYYT